jgi:hypothetical protein
MASFGLHSQTGATGILNPDVSRAFFGALGDPAIARAFMSALDLRSTGAILGIASQLDRALSDRLFIEAMHTKFVLGEKSAQNWLATGILNDKIMKRVHNARPRNISRTFPESHAVKTNIVVKSRLLDRRYAIANNWGIESTSGGRVTVSRLLVHALRMNCAVIPADVILPIDVFTQYTNHGISIIALSQDQVVSRHPQAVAAPRLYVAYGYVKDTKKTIISKIIAECSVPGVKFCRGFEYAERRHGIYCVVEDPRGVEDAVRALNETLGKYIVCYGTFTFLEIFGASILIDTTIWRTGGHPISWKQVPFTRMQHSEPFYIVPC